MAGPWEQYQQAPAQPDGPWAQYGAPNAPEASAPAAQERTTLDKLTGWDGGTRYQTWPERLVRDLVGSAEGAATLPGDVYAGRQAVDLNDPEFIRRATDLASFAAPVNPAARAGDRVIPGMSRQPMVAAPVKVPTTQELRDAGARDIMAAKSSGLEVTPSSVSEYGLRVQQGLFDDGMHPSQAPQTYAILKELQDAPADAVFTPANLQALRESLGGTAQNFNPNFARDQLAASRAISAFDRFLSDVDPQDVLAGTPAATRELFERGRGNYAAAMRSNDITGVLDRARTGILERAEGRSAAANSGRNLDNTIRSRVESTIEKPKEISGLNDEEIAALAAIVKGGPVRNTARYAGNLFGGGGGLGQAVTGGMGAAVGAGAGGAPGALVGAVAPAAVGAMSKTLANTIARRELSAVDELLRKRSPLFLERQAAAPMSPRPQTKVEAIIRALILGAPQSQQAP